MPIVKKTDVERLADAEEIIRRKNHENVDLKRALEAARRENDTADKLRQELYQLAEYVPNPPAWTTGKGGKIGMRGCPITVWSDIHYGEVVNPAEVNGLNEYNAKIAKERLFRLFDTTVDLAYNHMGRAKTEYPGIIVCLGGDMIGGDIHEELLATNDRTPHQSVNELTDILGAGLEQMASKFGRVYAPGVVGNHGRSTKKMRMKGRVWTNYDWSIYCQLERYFRKDKHVHIDVPNTADAHFKSYGDKYMLTHGDSLGVRGGDGIIGAIGPIMRGSIKIGNQVANIGQDFDHIIMGHWHQTLMLPGVFVNGAVKGFDEYANLQLRARYARPSQLLWFNHPEHGITARWEIFLEGRRKAAPVSEWVTWPKD